MSTSLARLERCSGFDRLRKELIDPHSFGEALEVLQIAERMHNVGLNVDLDVPLSDSKTSKVPDIKIYDAAAVQVLFCEVSVLYSAQQHGDIYELHERLNLQLLSHDNEPLAYAGRLYPGALHPGALQPDTDAILNRVCWEILEILRDLAHRFACLINHMT